MTALAIDCHVARGEFRLEVNVSLPLGGITAVFGPSGSGKSTLLRVIAGLEREAFGRVAFAQEVWQDRAVPPVPAHRRGAAVVFQDSQLFNHLSVMGNLAYAERRAPGKPLEINLKAVAEAMDLFPLLQRRADSLSGGERQRVAIARALLSRPNLLLMDEPLAALDSARKVEIMVLIEALPETFGLPILYVSHSVDEVAQLADSMVLLSHGKVAAYGPVGEILQSLDLHPLTGRFEAGVVLEAEITAQDPTYAMTLVSVAGAILSMPFIDGAVGDAVRLRVRARDVSVALNKPENLSIQNILPGTLADIRREPETAFAELLIDIGGPKLRSRITRKSADAMALQKGKPVFALIDTITFDRRGLKRLSPRDR
ncbi:MAG: molybdenum ABC transporter ATP-binding protein [Magnetospiraceae bacterium]